ncbi:MAG: methyltransferase domain-containing protein [Candidatus Bathyarchaeota archaeon]|nr:MAG: methyltransferase domain-containing protein [Candidatus Bathyarchaeota archaeon]
MILDIGCGSFPLGDVNVDAKRGVLPTYIETISKKIVNFVFADAEHLPFRENTFNVVYASHLLEHVEHPFNVLLECNRVSCNVVYLHVPSPRCPNQSKYHIYRWDSNTFETLLRKVFSDVKIYSSARIVPRMGKLNMLQLIIEKLYRALFSRRQMTAICYNSRI